MSITRREFIACSTAAVAIPASALLGSGSYDLKTTTRKENRAMLKGISPVISPDLLKTLAEMGHGDEIVISDAHFPAHTFNDRVIRADGIGADKLLEGIIPLFELDAYAVPVIMMAAVPGDTVETPIWDTYAEIIKPYTDEAPEMIERFAFYDRAKKAYAVVISGETAKYGNIIIKKGVIPVAS